MRIECPYCGSRDLREFSFLGDAEAAGAALQDAGVAASGDVTQDVDRVYLRDNPAGRHVGLWYHEAGCRSWLRVDRDTSSHAIFAVALAKGDAA